MKGWVIGFDLSLSAPAAVALPLDWRPGQWKTARVWTLHPAAPKKDDLEGQLKRYREIRAWASGAIKSLAAPTLPCRGLPHIFIEQYAFSRNNAQGSKLMELGGIVRMEAFERFDALPTVVSTSSARTLFLGTLRGIPPGGQKVAVQHALFNKLKAPKTWSEDVCDAFVVANFGLSEVGGKMATLAA